MNFPVYRIRCEGCGIHFDWTPKEQVSETPPTYHSKACKNRKRVRLHRATKPMKCPHPEKKLYRTHKEAMEVAKRMEDDYLKPYRCRCGGIHLGHAKFHIKEWIEV